MLDINIINNFFTLLSSETDITKWNDLLELCKREIEESMQNGAESEHMQKLCYAAAAKANYRFCLKSCAGNITSFKAGDISISTDDALSTAKSIYIEAMSSLKGILREQDFAFICV